MSFALHRVTNAWLNFEADPCAKTTLALARLVSQHQYDPQWPCHAWFQTGSWQTSPWFPRWHSALLCSLRTSAFAVQEHDNILFARLCKVARWPEHHGALKNIVAPDALCAFEWWVLGAWLDQKSENTSKFSELVAMWDPVWALAAPQYSSLGWRNGLRALQKDIKIQGEKTVDKIDGSTCWLLD